MRSILLAEQNILNARAAGTGRVRTRHRVRIQDNAGVWQTYTAEAIRGRIRRSKDEPVATAEVTLAYRTAGNLSPWANVARPVDLSRGIQIESAYLDAANNPIAWHLRFDGFIQSVEPSGDWEMTITCRDHFGRLVDRYTEQERTYGGGQRVDLVIQQILNDWISPAVTLFVPTLPAADQTVANDQFREGPVAEMVRNLALRIGWDLSFRWDAGTASYRLTLVDPARGNATPTFTFEPALFERLDEFGIERTNLRNRIEVVHGSGETRGSVIVQDAASISAHGTLYMRLGEDAGLKLQNAAQATTVANAILSDLASPFVDAEYRVPYFPFAELNNVYRFGPTHREYDSDQILAVVGIEEAWETQDSHTESHTVLAMRGRPVGGRSVWPDVGNTPPQQPPGTVTPPGAPTGLAGTFTTGDAIITWNPIADAAQYEVRVLTGAVLRRTAHMAEPGFTYTLEMNRADHAAPSASVTFEVRAIRSAAEGGVRSSAAVLALANPAPPAPASVTLVGEVLNFRASVPEPPIPDYLRTEWQADDNSDFTSPTSVAAGPDWQGVRIGIEATTGLTWVRARYVDVFGQPSGWASTSSVGVLVGDAHIADQIINTAKFATGIRPVGIGSALPAHPYTGYVEGDLFMLVVGGVQTMHRLTNPAGADTTGWTVAIATQDIQIGAITADRIAANAVTATAILAGAVTAGKIAAGAISATEIAANAITSPAIAAGAVTAGKIAAGAVSATEIAANAITTDRIAANAVTTDRIASGSIATRHLLIGDTSNIFPDQPLRDIPSWTSTVGFTAVDDAGFIHGRALHSAAPPPTGQVHLARSAFIPVEPGAQYYVQFRVWSQSAGNAIALQVATETPGPRRYTILAHNTNMPAGGLMFAGIVTIPGDANRMQVSCVREAGDSGAVVVGNFVVRRAIDERLVAQLGASTRVDHQGLRTRDGGGVTRVAMGDLNGLPWGTEVLPANTFGFFGEGANIYLADYPRLIAVHGWFLQDRRTLLVGDFARIVMRSTINLSADYRVAAGRHLTWSMNLPRFHLNNLSHPQGFSAVTHNRIDYTLDEIWSGLDASGTQIIVNQHPLPGPFVVRSLVIRGIVDVHLQETPRSTNNDLETTLVGSITLFDVR